MSVNTDEEINQVKGSCALCQCTVCSDDRGYIAINDGEILFCSTACYEEATGMEMLEGTNDNTGHFYICPYCNEMNGVNDGGSCTLENGTIMMSCGYCGKESIFDHITDGAGKLMDRYPDYDFVVVPDIVAGGMESLYYSLSFVDTIKRPRYLAVQDKMYSQGVRRYLSKFDGIFVGGTIPWKMQTMKMWVDIAHLHGIKCHVGRIGNLQGYLICNALGVDSVDGTYPSRNADSRPVRAFAEQANFNDYDWFDIGPDDYRWKNLCESV